MPQLSANLGVLALVLLLECGRHHHLWSSHSQQLLYESLGCGRYWRLCYVQDLELDNHFTDWLQYSHQSVCYRFEPTEWQILDGLRVPIQYFVLIRFEG